MRTKQRNSQRKMLWAGMFITLVVIILCSGGQDAAAQQWSTSGNDISNTNSGNVGVGTTSPGVKLDILSSVNLIARFGSTAGAHSQVLIDAPAAFNSNLTLQRGGVSKWYIGNRASNDRLSFIESTGVIETLTLLQNGNIGIGTTSPGNYKLNVNGSLFGAAMYTSYVADGLYGATAVPSRIKTHNSNGGILFGYEDLGMGDYSPRIGLQQTYDVVISPNITTTKASIGLVRNGNITIKGGASNGEFVRIDNFGNVGIGTTAPGHKLQVAGTIRSSSGGFVFPDGTVQVTAAGDPSSQWTTSAANIHYTPGSVGINVTNPLAKLHVVGVAPWGTATFMGTTWPSHFNYNGDTSEDTYIRGGKSNSRVLINDGHSGNVLMALNGVNVGGNVGIGTVTPTAKLHVVGDGRVTGNLTVDGNIAAKYQDMAEWVPAAEQLSAGIVVVLDTTKPNHVISSSTSYDARIAGVISAQPGIVLGEKSDNKVLVATTGRVRVKVTATNGPIQIGDLLVTSNSEGFAMKSLPVDVGGVRIHRPGTLIGKALEPLAKGTGEILVLLSLQ